MAKWQQIADEADKALRKVDAAHKDLEAEINAAYRQALADGKVDDAEAARIEELEKQGQQLKASRSQIVKAALKALDDSAEIAELRQTFVGIRSRLENRRKELESVEKVADKVGQALDIVARILTILI